MSLILEALRKSESERQLGQLPGLMSPVIPVRRRRPYRRWVLLALVLALGLGGGWWLAHRLAAPSLPVVPLGPAEQSVATTAKVTVSTATVASAGPVPDATSAPPAPAPVVPPASPPQAAEPPAAEAPATPPAAPSVVPVEAVAPSSPSAALPPARPPPAVVPAAAAPSEATAAPTAVADSVPLSQMPAAQRAALPPLKLSVHVFADEPSRRFAIIDGSRHAEGDELASGVRLREIQRHGVLLDIGGQPWLLERPR